MSAMPQEVSVFSAEFETIFSAADIDVDELSHDEFVRNYLDPQRPVIVRGGVADWPAIGKWTPEYIRNTIGHYEVPVRTISATQVAAKTTPVKELLGQLSEVPNADTKSPYLTKLNVHDWFPELADDVSPLPHYSTPDRHSNRLLVPNLRYPNGQMEMLMGGGGLGFPLHIDRGCINAFIMQIYGQKDFVIIDPSYADKLYPSKEFPQVSDIENIWKPDLDRFPNLKEVRGVHARLNPGDLIFVPSGWWHSTCLPGISIGTTCNSVSRANWSDFQQFYVQQRAQEGMSRTRQAVWSAYLSMVAVSSRLHETFFGR